MSGPIPRLPDWVFQLVHDLERAEETHPTFFVQSAGSTDFQKAESCYLAPLLELVPDEIRRAVEFAARWRPDPTTEG